MENFRCFQLAKTFYQESKNIKLGYDAKNQLDRAARSIALNLAEGYGKRTSKDRKKYFQIAYGSCKEFKALLILENFENSKSWEIIDSLNAHVYKLIRNAP